ncbi:plasmid partitioning protein RepB C-terminal domain-containing protein [Cronobacter sakazakii]|uniref:ParB/RepB/Spo0J family partition protein n=2 Tax=Cronobacter sakazakii TaxID=28141 RepID=UPI000A195C98|nr:plasmid partitioning protein RepB C-terminal domain-containing protein [Cronobacter sakazakii]MCI0196388.1 chromosome partitioning protein ParB [Cronobacter sakazakii]MCI0226023.1 chromosome partitioning protein ParB [Cronobacter sakazakii]MDQ9180727.1 plasmid partitioning protein RepB C-terminal domain-containing protein [Cronobacter sakazakii]MDT3659676.1 plasmid partitioning protein RepB C-terminal domain-containing protein [Cronobacter sakazakii]PQX86395.1 chromosome partitioning protei
MIKLRFGDNFIYLDTNKLTPSKELLENVKRSHKYHQIVTSIESLGIIEPIIVFYDKENDVTKILDGHLRVEALKDLGIEKAPCILSSINDAFTPNKQVNHINVVEEHRMIMKSLAKVSMEKLSAALGISIESIKDKANVMNGIDPSVIPKLSDKPIPKATFDVLRKMKPVRQIEAVGTMINFDNYSRKFAMSILDATPASLIVNKGKNVSYKRDIRKNIFRLEQEMATTSDETKKLQNEYGSNMLKFVIIQSYINKLLGNPKVLHWFLENEIDYLNELKRISSINSLDEKTIKREI